MDGFDSGDMKVEMNVHGPGEFQPYCSQVKTIWMTKGQINLGTKLFDSSLRGRSLFVFI